MYYQSIKELKMTIREHYNHAKADAQKAERRKEANERAAVRAKRTTVQQLARLDAGGYAAKKRTEQVKKEGGMI